MTGRARPVRTRLGEKGGTVLVLERKPDDRIVVGPDVEIVVVKVRGNTVWLGIDAPRDVKVLRGELLDRGRGRRREGGR